MNLGEVETECSDWPSCRVLFSGRLTVETQLSRVVPLCSGGAKLRKLRKCSPLSLLKFWEKNSEIRFVTEKLGSGWFLWWSAPTSVKHPKFPDSASMSPNRAFSFFFWSQERVMRKLPVTRFLAPSRFKPIMSIFF